MIQAALSIALGLAIFYGVAIVVDYRMTEGRRRRFEAYEAKQRREEYERHRQALKGRGLAAGLGRSSP